MMTKDKEQQKDDNSDEDKKMTTNSFARVSKMHIKTTKGTRLIMEIFFLGSKGHQEVKGPRYNFGGH
jgi:4-hydroxy-3-methylbut-2-enyl diphosphate reductase IspH